MVGGRCGLIRRRDRRPPSMPQVPGRVTVGPVTGPDAAGPATGADDGDGGTYGRRLPARWPSSPAGDRGSAWPRATRLAEAGVSVAVVDLDGASAERAAGRARRPRACRPTSVAPEAWPGIVEAVTARFGGIDLAHLNAGVMTGEADITKLTDDIYRRAVGVNVDGVVFGVRALVPALSARGGGAIVATASLAGLIGFSPDPIYCLTKHAVVGLVRSLVPQLAEHQITINAVCPSIVDTPLIDDMPRPAGGQRVPAHRRGGGGRGGGRPACPARRPVRPWSSRPVGRRCPSASPVLPGPGPAARWARCRRRVRRPRPGLRPSAGE